MALAPIPFFTDENVPDSVGWAISDAGHILTRLRECMVPGSKDQLIALTCARAGQVLVSHDNDFTEIARRLHLSKFGKNLHRIDLKCDGPIASRRMRELMSLIEHEWTQARILTIPLLVIVGNEIVKIRR
jgi:predicted nuclease of predicted toxin-antitoxin system